MDSIEPEVYEAAQAAANRVAEGLPSWVTTVIVNAAIEAYAATRGP